MNLILNLKSREKHFLTSGISHPRGICHPILRYVIVIIVKILLDKKCLTFGQPLYA